MTARAPAAYNPRMLGLSLSKLLFTLASVLLVWHGWRWWGRVQARRQAELHRRMHAELAKEEEGAGRRQAPGAAVDDMVPCAVCRVFASSGSRRACGRDDCPYTTERRRTLA